MSSRLFCFAFKTFFYVSRLRHEQTEARLRLREAQMSPSNLLVANVTEPPADTWLSAWLGAFNLSIILPSPWTHRQGVCVWGGHVGPKVLVCTRRCGTFQHQDSSPHVHAPSPLQSLQISSAQTRLGGGPLNVSAQLIFPTLRCRGGVSSYCPWKEQLARLVASAHLKYWVRYQSPDFSSLAPRAHVAHLLNSICAV